MLYGGQVEVRARASGRPADKLWLVANSGTNALRAIMFLAPDKTFFQTLANLREPTEYYVTDGQARSHRFPIGIRYTPQITLVEVTTTFPQYTGLAPRTAKLSEEPQALPEDTKVSFRVASNRPLKSGQLTLTPVLGGKPAQIALKPEGEKNIVSGGFTLTEPVVFSVSVRDVNDLDSVEPRQGRFNLLPDERPRIFVLEPGRDAVATPSIRVPVRVEATDDYGITRVVWLRGLNRSIERPFNMKLTLKSGPQSVEAAGAFEFDKLGVRPGDVIEYYFEAADNYPKGPNVTLSKLYRVEIISKEQYEAILRMAAARKALFEPYFQLGAWLRRLAERARNVAKQAESGSEADKQAAAKEAEALADDLAKYEGELGKLLQEAVLFDVEQSFRNTLVEQHTAIGQARQKLRQGLRERTTRPQEAERSRRGLEPTGAGGGGRRGPTGATDCGRGPPAGPRGCVCEAGAATGDPGADVAAVCGQERGPVAHRADGNAGAGLPAAPNPGGPACVAGILAATAGDHPGRAAVCAVARGRGEVCPGRGRGGDRGGLEEQRAEPVVAGWEVRLRAGPTGGGEDGPADQQVPGHAGATPRPVCTFKPSVQQAMGNTLEQILAAMGAKPGNGQGGQDGYALFNDDVALYGPNVELAGEQGGGRRERGQAAARRAERVPGEARDPALKQAATPGRVRLQPDAKFPLRYRDLVGEYFRVIGESEREKGVKK